MNAADCLAKHRLAVSNLFPPHPVELINPFPSLTRAPSTVLMLG